MGEEKPRKRHTQFTRSARDQRILERLREGASFERIACEEALTERRVRQIVAERMEEREALEGATHARQQVDRLGRALQVAGDALARGDLRAIGPFIKVIDRLDRYQPSARNAASQRNTGFDPVVIKSIIGRLDAIACEVAEADAAAGAPAPEPDGRDAPGLPPSVAEAEA
ncbi:MAG: hypothetical protein JO288_08250 [Hyphomicrobiales bacterium]|nr:hypothetical protein [Hyphomicrobiales bacterium]